MDEADPIGEIDPFDSFEMWSTARYLLWMLFTGVIYVATYYVCKYAGASYWMFLLTTYVSALAAGFIRGD